MPKSILIMEDERPLAHALELKLQHEGYTTTVATNGKDGLALIQNGGYDVVLLDIMMPLMDGFQVLEQLRGMTPRPVIFVLSNLSQPEDEAKAKAAGANRYFVKADTPLSVIVDEVKKV